MIQKKKINRIKGKQNLRQLPEKGRALIISLKHKIKQTYPIATMIMEVKYSKKPLSTPGFHEKAWPPITIDIPTIKIKNRRQK